MDDKELQAIKRHWSEFHMLNGEESKRLIEAYEVVRRKWDEEALALADLHKKAVAHERRAGRLQSLLRRMTEAAIQTREWFNAFGEHAPIQFGGEAEIDEALRAVVDEAQQELLKE